MVAILLLLLLMIAIAEGDGVERDIADDAFCCCFCWSCDAPSSSPGNADAEMTPNFEAFVVVLAVLSDEGIRVASGSAGITGVDGA